ncbi:hypothetical protein K440DRAFT_663983 [Wilcoxina mikolae CBS 423.85]|nr:hypothetical protein K440DRAFT_663983 [Wilcoxina mikolae CBS 423.85]
MPPTVSNFQTSRSAMTSLRNSSTYPEESNPNWTKIGRSPKELQSAMEDLYWVGVHRDVTEIIRTLVSWEGSTPPVSSDLHGLGTFLSRATGKNGAELRDIPLIEIDLWVKPRAAQPQHLEKMQKQCILADCITPIQGREICHCSDVSSEKEALFPIEQVDYPKHCNNCGLLTLKELHNLAKRKELLEDERLHIVATEEHRTAAAKPSQASLGYKLMRQVSTASEAVLARSGQISESIKKQLIKRGVRPATNRIPFGNVHMALMVGTLVIEIGVPHTQRGALISNRDPLQFVTGSSKRPPEETVLALSPKRKVYRGSMRRKIRRIKASMKQVVGGLFSGLFKKDEETAVVKAVVDESRRCVYEPMKTQRYHNQKLRNSVQRIVQLLRDLFETRIKLYLRTIVRKLTNRSVNLTFSPINHCQLFCEEILDYDVFGNFVETKGDCRVCLPETPLYLLSFMCRPGSYKYSSKIHPSSKKATPNGLMEEYLLRFRYHSHHNDSDLFDTLQEYWYDWGAFGGPIFSHQDVFPWDCTEAYGTAANNSSQVKCNECSIAKHVFAFPFDSWSLVHMHVLREQRFYASSGGMSDQRWQQNRISVLLALEALNKVALGMAKTLSFRASCKWINLEPSTTHVRGTAPQKQRMAEKRMYMKDRVKLGGIHRAQPRSHHFEQSKYHDCTLAPWADLVRDDQIALYIRLRDHRADVLKDIPEKSKPHTKARNRSSRRVRPEIQPDRSHNDRLFDNWYEQDHEHDRHHHHHHHVESTTDVDNGDYFDLDIDNDFSALLYASDNYSSSDDGDDLDAYDYDAEDIVDPDLDQIQAEMCHLCICPDETTVADRSAFSNPTEGSRPNDSINSPGNDLSPTILADLFESNPAGYLTFLRDLNSGNTDDSSASSTNDHTDYSFGVGDIGSSSGNDFSSSSLWGTLNGLGSSSWGNSNGDSGSYGYGGGSSSGGWGSGCGGGSSSGGCGGSSGGGCGGGGGSGGGCGGS